MSRAAKVAIARAAAGASNARSTAERAGEQVFKALAKRILRGEIPPNTTLPSERELAERFGVSKMSIRQALYQLEELGLLRVRQGRATEVLDPDDAIDLRVMALAVEVASAGDHDTRDLAERVILHVADALVLAEERIDESELDELDATISRFENRGAPDESFVEFEMEFYTLIAKATKNRIFYRETRWWFRFLRLRSLDLEGFKSSPSARLDLCREIARRLRAREGAAAMYEGYARAAVAALLPSPP